MFGICQLTYIPVRSQTSGASEQVSQLIYGECYEVLREEKEWYYIKNLFDNYEGYISRAQFCAVDHVPTNIQVLSKLYLCHNNMFVPCGAHISGVGLEEKPANSENIIALATTFLNTPYLWGGRTFMGIDCSGLVQIVFKSFGINLPRDAKDQVNCGDEIDLKNAAAGDVAFFTNKAGKVTHTGILLENNQVIHAHGKVRIDTLDQRGIYNLSRSEYSHQLASIRRILV